MNTLKTQIEEFLAKYWDDHAIIMDNNAACTSDLGAPIDSLALCEVLIDIDLLVGKEIPIDVVVKNGGYETRDQFIHEITQNVILFLGDSPQ